MNLPGFVTAAYRFFEPRRRVLFAMVILVLGVSLGGFFRVRMQENIAAMLPDGGAVGETFRLLQKAPFAHKVAISVTGDKSSPEELAHAADLLATDLDPALFPRVVTGPDPRLQQVLVPWLLTVLPSLTTARDLERLEQELDSPGVAARLQESYRHLLGPEGWVFKGLVQRDPLGLVKLGLEKLRPLNLVPGARLVQGHFLSPDGRSALVVAETPVAMTDSRGSERLLQAFERAAVGLPPGIHAALVSGHRYTLANARTIRADMWRVLTASTLALVLLFVLFLRSWRSLFVFLVPVSVVCLGTVAVALVYGEVSAITIGFGAVLLGIAVDFGLHVYFALGRGRGEAADLVGAVSKPVTFGALTTLAAFAVLLFSDLPGQRQMALFAMTGIGAALVLALVVLPHLLRVGTGRNACPGSRRPSGAARPWVLAVWLVLLAGLGWEAARVAVNGDLGAMSVVPAGLAADEAQLRHTWGDVRGRGMLWSLGSGPQAALAAGYRVYEGLAGKPETGSLVSLAPLLPPPEVQRANQKRWREFWAGEQGRAVLAALDQEAGRLGFTPQAFAPFRASLAQTPPLVTPESLRQLGLGEVVEALLAPLGNGEWGALTLLPEAALRSAAVDRVLAKSPETRLVSQGRFRTEVSAAIERDFFRFIALAGAVVALLVTLLFRRPGRILAALAPVATGLVAMLGVMALLGMDLNLFNVIAAILVIGLGVDYGIFMVCRQREGLDCATERAVLVSGLTTLAGFGALVLARHPALHSIGLTVLLGIGAAIPTALWVIPALYRETRP
jgi:predicted exporter